MKPACQAEAFGTKAKFLRGPLTLKLQRDSLRFFRLACQAEAFGTKAKAGADGETRTLTPNGNWILNPARLPVPPHRLICGRAAQ